MLPLLINLNNNFTKKFPFIPVCRFQPKVVAAEKLCTEFVFSLFSRARRQFYSAYTSNYGLLRMFKCFS